MTRRAPCSLALGGGDAETERGAVAERPVGGREGVRGGADRPHDHGEQKNLRGHGHGRPLPDVLWCALQWNENEAQLYIKTRHPGFENRFIDARRIFGQGNSNSNSNSNSN